jgi:hypothetical protein
VFVVGGKAFTSTILQQNCHEFISYESLLPDRPEPIPVEQRELREVRDGAPRRDREPRGEKVIQPAQQRGPKQRPPALDLSLAMPLVERALQVLERRSVQPQLGLLKSTMLQLDSAFSERAYGAYSFSDFVDKLKKADLIGVSGSGGRVIIERRGERAGPLPEPEEALPTLRDLLENHRLELENGETVDQLSAWMAEEHPNYDIKSYGFQEFSELLNFAQDKTVVRLQPDEERGLIVFLGAEFYPPAEPVKPEAPPAEEEEDDGPQPYVEGQPTLLEPNPPPPKPKKVATRKRAPSGAAVRRPRKKKID